METGYNSLQSELTVFNRKSQFTFALFNADIEQERHQPVTRQIIVVLRQYPVHAGGIIGTRGEIGTEEQKVPLPNQRRELWQDLLRFEIGNHAEESDQARSGRDAA